MKFYTAILFLILAPLIMHHGIQSGGHIQNDTLRLLTWCALLLAMLITFVTACAYFVRH